MLCPQCHHLDSKVLDTRTSGDGIRRRRQCLSCGHRFTTHERVDRKLPLIVKKDGSREPFDRDKVVGGLQLALRKRPISARQIEDAASRIEQRIAGPSSAEISSTVIGHAVLNELKDIDGVGYLRFASVYLDVGSASDFLELLQPWLTGEAQRTKPRRGS